MNPAGTLSTQRAFLICFSIGANALCAGGIFMFPLLSPALASSLKLSQPQLTTIVLAGMMGQYPVSAFVGKVIDHYGPAACSLVASLAFSSAFYLFSSEVQNAPAEPTAALLSNLCILFLIAGFGTVFSYFSSVFAATKSFPNYPGVASGASMALFGLSPLMLSKIATTFFISPETRLLDVSSFMNLLAGLTGLVHLFGFITLQSVPQAESRIVAVPSTPDERTPLVAPKPPIGESAATQLPFQSTSTHTVPVTPKSLGDDEAGQFANGQSALDLFQDVNFWILAAYCLLIFGVCEMVISNLASIILSLSPPTPSSPFSTASDHTIAREIELLSLSNTLSRLVMGPLADFLSPVNDFGPRERRMSRVSFLSVTSLLVTISFLWMQYFATEERDIWALSIGIGSGYGASFTVLPSIVSAIWGEANLGRNFGIITYAPFIGTPLYSYLYAFVSASQAKTDLCMGSECWRLTFWISIGTSLLAFGGSLLLAKRWKGLL